MGAPAVMMGAGLGLGVAGAGLGMYGQYQAAKAQNRALKYNSQLMEYNAEVAQKRAGEAIKAGHSKEARFKTQVAQLTGKQQALYGASGVKLKSGTPQRIMREARYLGQLDALQIRANAAMEAQAYLEQAQGFEMQSKLYRSQRVNPWLGMTGTLLGKVGQLSFQGGQMAYFMGSNKSKE